MSFRNDKSHESPIALDAIDLRILRILQRDSLIGNQTLADRIGLSPPISSRAFCDQSKPARMSPSR